MVPLPDRFWPKVERRGYDECWPWTGATVRTQSGLVYGRVYVPGMPGGQPAHRVAFYLVHGRWPEPCGLHGCDFPLCCNAENPAHIHEGTIEDNNREMRERGRWSPPPVLMGSAANRSKLTDDQALEIIARYDNGRGGVSQEALATEYGVSQFAISCIVRGKRRSLQERGLGGFVEVLQ